MTAKTTLGCLAALMVLCVGAVLIYYAIFEALGWPQPPTVWWRWFVSWPVLLLWLAAFTWPVIHEFRISNEQYPDLLAEHRRFAILTLGAVPIIACLSVLLFNVFAWLVHSRGVPQALAAVWVIIWSSVSFIQMLVLGVFDPWLGRR